jgi:protein gp37
MSEDSHIEWTDHTFNPWSGCTKVSDGCFHCYAAALPPGMRRHAQWGPGQPRPVASEDYWRQPLVWARKAQREGRRARVFCASTADVFEDRADLDPHRERLWRLIAETPGLDWQLLTKRPAVMVEWAKRHGWPQNAWAGVSVENQQAADERLPHLLQVPARVRFLSMEPLLGPVANIERVHWVIVGGESGHRARLMAPDWARSIRDQCQEAGVPFFFKQWGAWGPDHLDRNWKGHRLLDGREWSQFPEVSRD